MPILDLGGVVTKKIIFLFVCCLSEMIKRLPVSMFVYTEKLQIH